MKAVVFTVFAVLLVVASAADCYKFTLKAWTSTKPYAASQDKIKVRFKVDGTWTPIQLFWDGPTVAGGLIQKEFELPKPPTEIRLIHEWGKFDGWCYWKLMIDDCLIDIAPMDTTAWDQCLDYDTVPPSEVRLGPRTRDYDVTKCYGAYQCPPKMVDVLRKIYWAGNMKFSSMGYSKGWKCFAQGTWCPKVCEPPTNFPKNDRYPSNYYGIDCKDGYPVRMDLAWENIKGYLSPAIGCMSYLKELDLSHNKLKGRIPENIKSLKTSMQYLNLDYNRFTSVDKGICKLSFCKTLDIYSNQIPGWCVPWCFKNMGCTTYW